MLQYIKDRRSKGHQAESLALDFLKRQGLKLVEKNFSCRNGEVDLIMTHRDCLVFIEVRYRQQASHGHPLETIDYRKQQKIIHAVQYYLLNNRKYQNLPCRIDALAISGNPDPRAADESIDWITNAIELRG